MFATLDHSGHLIEIYNSTGKKLRKKINIESGAINDMTLKQINESPVGARRTISLNFSIVIAKHDSMEILYH